MSSRRGFSLVEVAITALILGVMVVAYLTLGRQETKSVRDLRDRTCATSLARNVLSLVRNSHNRAWLDDAGTPVEPGVTEFPVEAVPQSSLAFGAALRQWVDQRGAKVAILWQPQPPGSPAVDPDILGRIRCVVTWPPDAPTLPEGRVDMPAVLER